MSNTITPDKRGGKRPGAGRPPALSPQLREAKEVAKRLWIGAQLGWGQLAKDYPSLIGIAVKVAKGDYDNGKPNVQMLRTLLELMPRVVGEESDPSDSPIQRLLKGLKDGVNLTQNNYYAVGEDGKRDTDGVGREAEPRMGKALLLAGQDNPRNGGRG